MPPLNNKKAQEKKQKLRDEQKLSEAEIYEIMTRYNNIEEGQLCTAFNTIEDEEEIMKQIYYPYYIQEVYKVIDVIENN